MKSLLLLAIFFAATQAVDLNSSGVKVEVVESIDVYLKANPNVTLTELNLNRNARMNQNWYTLGSRLTGDRLVAINNGWAQYPSKQNLNLNIFYPTSGIGAVLSYVQILIIQDNGTFGRGYVTSGGIGQRYIQIVVEAWNTAFIRYDYSLYGF